MRNGTLNTVIVAQKKQNKEVGTTKSEEMRIQEVVATGCQQGESYEETVAQGTR
jgi:hypothetical protein